MPSAALATLESVALLRRCVHEHMQNNQVLEVVTPALSQSTATDPHIHSYQVPSNSVRLSYLHTSPEFPMKRLLAAYQRDIYQMATVFRDGESGRRHNPEFSLLEWYRVGFDHTALMQDVLDLLTLICQKFKLTLPAVNIIRYKDAVANCCDTPLEQLSVGHIEQLFKEQNRSYPQSIGTDLDAALDLMMDEFVISKFPADQLTFLVDYPASQCALAKVANDQQGLPIAQRFELYWGSLELANGFNELLNSAEQRKRFEADNVKRQLMGLNAIPVDENFLQALKQGMPPCAGVALGLERLLMRLCNLSHIGEALAFSSDRA